MLRLRTPRRLGVTVVATVLIATAGAVSMGPAAAAQSGPECTEWQWVVTGENNNGDPTFGWRLIDVCQNDNDGNSNGGVSTCQSPELGEIDCYDPVMGWWSSSAECYVRLESPPPPPGDDAWEGNDPEDGSVYLYHCPEDAGTFRQETHFLTESPGGPSLEQIAQQAMDSLPLAGPDIGIAPSPEGVGLVGVPVWLWADNSDDVWGTPSVTVPGPGFAVVAEANTLRIEWDMGDGNVVVCDGDNPGIPYESSFGLDTPECGHVYSSPSQSQPGDGRYQITATVVWDLQWWVDGGSEAGGRVETRESSTSVQINELQVVTS